MLLTRIINSGALSSSVTQRSAGRRASPELNGRAPTCDSWADASMSTGNAVKQSKMRKASSAGVSEKSSVVAIGAVCTR